MRPWLFTLILLVFVVFGLFVLLAFLGIIRLIPTETPRNAPSSATQESALITAPTIRATDPVLGAPNAPVTIVSYEDLLCPFCKTMDTQLRDLVVRFPNDVRVIWKDLPNTLLHPQAGDVHIAAQCASAQGKFWEYAKIVFENQDTVDNEALPSLAAQTGINTARWQRCVENRIPEPDIRATIEEARQLGIDGTPFLFINDERFSGLASMEELEKIVRKYMQ